MKITNTSYLKTLYTKSMNPFFDQSSNPYFLDDVTFQKNQASIMIISKAFSSIEVDLQRLYILDNKLDNDVDLLIKNTGNIKSTIKLVDNNILLDSDKNTQSYWKLVKDILTSLPKNYKVD